MGPIAGRAPLRYRLLGSSRDLLIISGGGLNSTAAGLAATHPVDAMETLSTRVLEPVWYKYRGKIGRLTSREAKHC